MTGRSHPPELDPAWADLLRQEVPGLPEPGTAYRIQIPRDGYITGARWFG